MSRFQMIFLLNLEVACLFTLFEILKPERKIHYRKVFWADFSATLVNSSMNIMMILLLVSLHIIPFKPSLPILDWIHQRPFAFQFALYLVVADFGIYWAHRLMHNRHWWKFHRWHHYPQYMYWGAGYRASFMHRLIFSSVGILALPILTIEQSVGFFVYNAISFQVSNNIMHMNVSWNSRRLEWIFVTPRFHHLHHSSDIKVHNANYGAVFTFWDRLFGSYIDPAKVAVVAYGTGETKKHPWMFLGL